MNNNIVLPRAPTMAPDDDPLLTAQTAFASLPEEQRQSKNGVKVLAALSALWGSARPLFQISKAKAAWREFNEQLSSGGIRQLNDVQCFLDKQKNTLVMLGATDDNFQCYGELIDLQKTSADCESNVKKMIDSAKAQMDGAMRSYLDRIMQVQVCCAAVIVAPKYLLFLFACYFVVCVGCRIRVARCD
jgi:uncharacterized protein YaaQ